MADILVELLADEPDTDDDHSLDPAQLLEQAGAKLDELQQVFVAGGDSVYLHYTVELRQVLERLKTTSPR